MAGVAAFLTRLLTNRWIALAALAVGLTLLYAVEQQLHNMPFVLAVIAAIAALCFLLTAKPYVSLYGALALVLATTGVSVFKYRLKGFDLHVYDFVFTGSDPSAISFLFQEYLYLTGPALVLLLAGIAFIAFLSWRETRSGLRWGRRAALVFAAALALPVSYPLSAGEPRYFHYVGGFDASAFFVSMLDLQYLVEETALATRLEAIPAGPAFADTVECGDRSALPDVYFVLTESGVDPALFPQIPPIPELAPAFRSADGVTRHLTVEVFGGGTWISHLSLLAGLSSADFGFQGPYLTQVLQGKVSGTLPEVLGRCGYHTVAQLPLDYSFVNEGPFLNSIGFETVLDYDDIGATRHAERDRFYFDAARRAVARLHAEDDRPVFLTMETMFPHSPYTHEAAALEGGPKARLADDPELDEYLKRLTVSKQDFQAFLAELAKNPGKRGAVVLEYGDHQPFVTKGLADAIAGKNALADFRSIAYRTEFTVHAFGRDLDMTPFGSRPIDIAFLGPAFLEAARLPTSPLYRDLAQLNRHCVGVFHLCADRAAIDRHLARRVASGMLALR